MESLVIKPILECLKKSFVEISKRISSGTSFSAEKIPPYTKIEFQNNPAFVYAAMMQDMCVLISIESNLFEERGFIEVCLTCFFVQNFWKCQGE